MSDSRARVRTGPAGAARSRHVALLRAINVGGHTVTMDRLRALFTALKLANVETFIASGNVIFDEPADEARALEDRIERHLKKSLGYEVATFIRSGTEIAAVAAHEPFAARELSGPRISLYVAFLKEAPPRNAARTLLSFKSPADAFRVEGRDVYWLVRGGFVDSKFSGALLEKTLGMPATIRNVTTVRKLAVKYGPGIPS